MENNTELKSIVVTIAERPYKLAIEPEQEKFYEQATEYINNRLKMYAETFQFKEQQDLLAMIALKNIVKLSMQEQVCALQEKL